MNKIQFHSIEPLVSSSLVAVDAAFGKVNSSFKELIDSALELAAVENSVQAALYSAPDDDEDENQPVNDALSLREDAKFDVAVALDRALKELDEQERTLNDTRSTLEQIKESLQIRNNALSCSMEIGPKPGCAFSTPQPEK